MTTDAVQTWHEPDNFQSFRCLGAECEDTCCRGWGITVDQKTYDRYQTTTHPELGPKLQKLVTIQSTPSAKQYAMIKLEEASCPFLSQSLCSLQEALGADHLSQACATFPRVVNRLEGAIERSLDVSCPEAARLVLLNPKPDFFQEFAGPVTGMDERMIEIAQGREPRAAMPYANEIRGFAMWILQNRLYSVEKRMLLLSHFCAKLTELEKTGAPEATGQLLDGFQLAIQAKLFDEHLGASSAEPSAQLAIVLELVVARVSLDYTAPSYRDLYGQFMQGLELGENSSIPELGERYSQAYFAHYLPFMTKRAHILEHYLVSYAYKHLFPAGAGSVNDQYLWIASYFGIVRTLLIGLAGLHRSAFSEEHVVRAVQVCARTLEHCTLYPAKILEVLASKGIVVPAATAVITQNLPVSARVLAA